MIRQIGVVADLTRSWTREACIGIGEVAQRQGDWSLRLLDGDLPQKMDRRTLAGFSGFVTVCPELPAAFLRAVGDRPIVDLFGIRHRTKALSVMNDNFAIGRMAARHLLDHRFVNFGFCGYPGVRFSDERQEGFAHEVAAAGYPCAVYTPDASAVREIALTITLADILNISHRPSLLAWIRSFGGTVALFCANDILACYMSELCHANGLRVPTEVALVGVDDDPLVCHFTTPMLTTIDSNAREVGRRGAETLQVCLSGHAPTGPVLIPPKCLIERDSTAMYPLDPPWLGKALVEIWKHACDGLRPNELFASLGLNRTLVQETFRRVLGSSVSEVIVRVRLAAACRKLEDTELDVKDIARHCGYASDQYFCRDFRARKGCTPNEWRAKSRKRD